MVLKIKLYKMEFQKNDDEKGGAMSEAIRNRRHGEIIIHTQTKKYGRAWGSCCPNGLLSLLDKNRGIYEVLTDYPRKVYVDIDAETDTLLAEDARPQHLQKKLDILLSIFPGAEFAVSGSYTDTKISYHVILHNYIIHNETELLAMKAIIKHIHDTIDTDFDWKVYTKNRNMKAINQSKPDGRVQEIISDNNWKNHLITCFMPDYPLPFPEFAPEIQEAILIAKSKSKFNIADLPKINLPTPTNFTLARATPTEYLAMLPLDKSFNHSYTHRVARFCKANLISFDTFLKWLEKKHTPMSSEIAAKWNSHWANLDKYPPVSKEQMRPLLASFYPDLKKDSRLRDFLGQFHLSQDIPTTQIERLGQEHYSNEKCTILHLPMGSGKTAQTIDYLKSRPSFCWIGHRQALHFNTITRIHDAGVECTDYTKSKKDKAFYGNATNLSIVINSLIHVPNTKTFDTIIIDEVESLLFTLKPPLPGKGDFVKNKKQVLTTLIRLLKSANKIIVIDAFITQATIDFIKFITNDIHIIFSKPKITNTIHLFQTTLDTDSNDRGIENNRINQDKQAALHAIGQELINNKKVFIFYPFKKDMAAIENTLIEIANKCGKNINVISYNADSDDETKQTLKRVNETWSQYDVIITNAVITCGVNFDLKYFDSCWIFMVKFCTPRDMIQVSARIRHLADKKINMIYLGTIINDAVYIDDRRDMDMPEYESIYKNYLIEDMAPKRKAFESLCGKAGYKLTKTKYAINAEVCDEIDKLLNDTDCTIKYDSIENIDSCIAEIYQNAMLTNTATMHEKYALSKFFWKLKFKLGPNPEQENKALAEIWDAGYKDYFDSYDKINDETSIFTAIKLLNKWDDVIPPETFKTVAMDTQIIDRIFTEYTFPRLHKASNKCILFKTILNTSLGHTVVECKDDHHTSSWSINQDFIDIFITLSSMLPLHIRDSSNDGYLELPGK